MHLPPQAAGPDRSHFSYNTQIQPPRKPRSNAEPKPQSPSLITEKRGRPRPKGGNNIAFNYECCNYIIIAASLLAESPQYTLVSGPDGPLTRRYAPTSGKPSSGPLRPRTDTLSWLKAGMVWQGWGGKVKSINQYRLTPGFGGFTPVPYATTECRLPCRWRGISW